MRPESAKFDSWLMTGKRKENRGSTCTKLKDHLEADPEFIPNTITGDEGSVYGT